MNAMNREDRFPPRVRRLASGVIDNDYYHRRARRARGEFLRAAFLRLIRYGWRTWNCVAGKARANMARRQLMAMTARELKDLALVRNDVEAVVNNTYASDTSRDARSRARLKTQAE